MHILVIKEVSLASFTEEKAEAQGNAGQCLASSSAIWFSPGKSPVMRNVGSGHT